MAGATLEEKGGSRRFMEFMNRQKLLQFLMGLNESYKQAYGHILMLISIPSVNQAYFMMIERESQINMTNVTSQVMNMEISTVSSGRGTYNNNKPKKNWNVQYDHCKIMGHAKGDQRSQANFVRNDYGRVYNDAGPNRAAYTDPNRDLQNNEKSAMITDNHKAEEFFYGSFGDWYRGPEKVVEPLANMSNMGSNAFASILPTTDSAGNASNSFMPRSEKNWIIDTGDSNHMISDKDMLNSAMTNVPQATPDPLLDAQSDDPVVDQQIDEPAVDIPAVAVPRQSNRPRKLPTWINDFVTNSVVVSTPYPLSQSLGYAHLSSQYQDFIHAHSCISKPTSYQEACTNPH
ncbi:hypothetical protein H5410_038443 [Solanum commersonii]|uniref:Uncharacterized protein n=1 Tax=Solanum commersonii TaxID=4109 RepID=A0A9J5Y8Z1_SOLCO|nr:hypothetical protein H5410_038443 [Solanum commersonii]